MKSQGSFGRSKFILASILAAGAVAPVINQPAPSVRVSPAAGASIAGRTADAQDRALPPAPGAGSNQVIGIIGGMGGTPCYMTGRSGLNRKEWGMSEACRRMVRKNAGIARGISAQRL